MIALDNKAEVSKWHPTNYSLRKIDVFYLVHKIFLNYCQNFKRTILYKKLDFPLFKNRSESLLQHSHTAAFGKIWTAASSFRQGMGYVISGLSKYTFTGLLSCHMLARLSHRIWGYNPSNRIAFTLRICLPSIAGWVIAPENIQILISRLCEYFLTW